MVAQPAQQAAVQPLYAQGGITRASQGAMLRMHILRNKWNHLVGSLVCFPLFLVAFSSYLAMFPDALGLAGALGLAERLSPCKELPLLGCLNSRRDGACLVNCKRNIDCRGCTQQLWAMLLHQKWLAERGKRRERAIREAAHFEGHMYGLAIMFTASAVQISVFMLFLPS